MTSDIHTNEVRDYIARAPKRKRIDGKRVVWNTEARLKWLASLCRGSIDERINRRAGIVDIYQPWKLSPVFKASRRHRCNELRKRGIHLLNS